MLASHLPEKILPDLAPYKQLPAGCRGFIGPVPPPLWISAPHGAIQLYQKYIKKYVSIQVRITLCQHPNGDKNF